MASIFLVNPPHSLHERYGKLAPAGSTLPHLGLLMLGAVLQKSGHLVRIVDSSAQGLTHKDTIKEIKNFQPDIIGITAVTPSILKAVKLASMVKELFPSTPVLIGGPHVTANLEKTLTDYPVFDYAIIGEGEKTVTDIVEALSSNEVLSNVPGIAFYENGKVVFTPHRPYVMNLDTLPFPAWDLLDHFPSQYHPALFKYKKLPSTHIISSRGCPYQCIFCDTSVFSRQIRFHSPEYVLEMISFLIKDFNIKEIIFEDDLFLYKKERVESICNGLLKKKLNIAWSCSGRVNLINDPGLLKLMKRSGCWQINYGIESADQKILNFAQKGITVNQVEKALKLTHNAGILAKGYFILGLPFETEETMEKTISFAKYLPLADVSVFMLTPFPGSKMYEIAGQYGTCEDDIEKMNVLDVVYVPEGLSEEKMIYYQRRFMKEFYLRPVIFANYFKRLLLNPFNMINILKAFHGFVKSIS